MSRIASRVSRVSASGSTRRKVFPAASNVDTCSGVSSRYGVGASSTTGSISWY